MRKRIPFGSPQQITLVDLPAILVTDRDQIDVQLSDQATLEMETAPAVGEQSPPSDQSVLKSMFQPNDVAIKITRPIAWKLTNSTSCIYMLTAY